MPSAAPQLEPARHPFPVQEEEAHEQKDGSRASGRRRDRRSVTGAAGRGAGHDGHADRNGQGCRRGPSSPARRSRSISDTRGTQLPVVVSNTSGDFTFVNVSPDTYTMQITMDGFKTFRRSGVPVSAGDRYAVGALVDRSRRAHRDRAASPAKRPPSRRRAASARSPSAAKRSRTCRSPAAASWRWRCSRRA